MSIPQGRLRRVANEQPGDHSDGIPPMSARWAGILAGQHSLALPFRAGRRPIVLLAVLFADVRGYMSICERVAAAEVHEFLQRFYQTASAALLAQEGLLAQIAGD